MNTIQRGEQRSLSPLADRLCPATVTPSPRFLDRSNTTRNRGGPGQSPIEAAPAVVRNPCEATGTKCTRQLPHYPSAPYLPPKPHESKGLRTPIPGRARTCVSSWVHADTFSPAARWVRNASTSTAPISRGCRQAKAPRRSGRRWYRRSRATQCQYASSVLGEYRRSRITSRSCSRSGSCGLGRNFSTPLRRVSP